MMKWGEAGREDRHARLTRAFLRTSKHDAGSDDVPIVTIPSS
jgi:hypothetical protein